VKFLVRIQAIQFADGSYGIRRTTHGIISTRTEYYDDDSGEWVDSPIIPSESGMINPAYVWERLCELKRSQNIKSVSERDLKIEIAQQKLTGTESEAQKQTDTDMQTFDTFLKKYALTTTHRHPPGGVIFKKPGGFDDFKIF
jgi:hypothetical protein